MAGPDDPDDGALRKRQARGARLLKGSPLRGASFSHRMGDTLMTVTDEKTIRQFARIYSIDDKPVYVIGVTNNTDDFNNVTEKEYARLSKNGQEAIMGKWVDDDGVEFNDVSVVMSGIGEKECEVTSPQQ